MKVLSVLALALALSASPQAQAQGFPNKALRIIVPVTPGGNLDIVTRAVAEPLSRALGQPVVVENRPGASSLVGTQLVAKSPADGYTLLSIANTFSSAPAILANAGYDPVKDFTGVSLTCRIPMVLLVHPEVPASSVKEFIALVRGKPGELRYATAGIGSTGHIATELFGRAAGLKLTMVPYKGNAQAIADVVGGHVPVMFDQVSTASPFVTSGKLRPLGVTTRKRAAIMPNVPTNEEAGVPGYEDSTFNGLIAPAGTPADVLQRLHTELAKVLGAAELRDRFAGRGVEIMASDSPAEFTAFLAGEARKYVTLAREVGIKAE
jgi:tripartite-type tricarboxylate transporter receptor subunit TctC